MTIATERLAALHSQIVDARKGYEEAVDLAEAPDMIALFGDLRDLHQAHAAELANALVSRGFRPEADGTFMTVVHRAVLNVRAALTGLDSNVLPAIRDGEERNLDSYDEALAALTDDPEAVALLERQRDAVAIRIEALEMRVETAR